MVYFLDTEFNGFGGELISLSLVREDGESLYIVYPEPVSGYCDWVRDNVVPILWDIPEKFPGVAAKIWDHKEGSRLIHEFFQGDNDPTVICDWPDDISYLCKAMVTGPGEMIPLARMKFQMIRIVSYPTALPGAIQHNAYWDARAIRYHFLVK